MTEIIIMPECAKNITKENLIKFGLILNINADKTGFEITLNNDNITKLFGCYDYKHKQIYSFYPGRCIGQWLNILKIIDKNIITLEIILDEHYEEYYLREINTNLYFYINRCREKLGLNFFDNYHSKE